MAEADGLPGPAPKSVMFVWILSWLVIVILCGAKLADSFIERATIIASRVEVKSGPSESNATMLEFQEGLEVLVKESFNGWHQIEYPGSLTGWVPENTLMITSGGGPW